MQNISLSDKIYSNHEIDESEKYKEKRSYSTEEDEVINQEISPNINQMADNFDILKAKRVEMLTELNHENDENNDDIGIIIDFQQNENIPEEEKVHETNPTIKVLHEKKNINKFGYFNEKIVKNPISQLLISRNIELPSISGNLKKRSPHFLQGWQDRFCKIAKKKFIYFDQKNTEKIIGCIDFDLVTVRIEEIKEKKFKIYPFGSKKTFLFKAKDKAERDKWVTILKENINKSNGVNKNLTFISKIPKFWKSDRISQTYFLQKADTGDILLFQTKNIAAKIQRSFTGSQYDHVAMILRDSDGHIILLEATGKEGVGLCKWKFFMKNRWHLLYSKLVYRQLEIERNEEMIVNIETFVKNVIGKKFKISASKLLKKKSLPNDLDDKQNSYFCSELVAACYKKLKLLPKEISCSSYWPGSFSNEKKLPLIGAQLSSELLIDFSLH